MISNNIRVYRPKSPKVTKDSCTLIEEVETAINRPLLNLEFQTAKNKLSKSEFEKKKTKLYNSETQKYHEIEQNNKNKDKKVITINEALNETMEISMIRSNKRKILQAGSLQEFFTESSSSSNLYSNDRHNHNFRRMSACSEINFKEKKLEPSPATKPSRCDSINFNDKNWINQPTPYNSMNQNIQVFMEIEMNSNEMK